MRIGYGWGLLPEEAWRLDDAPIWPPPPEPPGLDALAKKYRFGRYRRVRTMKECKQVLAYQGPVIASFEITDKWFSPFGGKIPPPSPDDTKAGYHAVCIAGYDDSKAEFKLINSWGMGWGDNAIGYIRYDSYEAICCEMWLADLRQYGSGPAGHTRRSWGFIEAKCGVAFYCREFVGPGEERIAWTFALEREDGEIEVEELFVRPQFRKQGYGTQLVRSLKELAGGSEIKIWISHADVDSENITVIEKLARPLGLRLQNSATRWAPIVARRG
jgi:GNAT superfamily N-acetyltransferase